jgi:dTMP kinase
VTRSLFISFEGPDGSGKSTQAAMLARALRARGMDVIETREPGGTAVGEQIRHILLDPTGVPMSALCMALLLSAARAQHMEGIVQPALGAGHTVITDRFADSTVAYQGYGMGLDLDTILKLTAIATGGRMPDLTVYVDIEPRVGLERATLRGGANRLDNADLEFHERVRDGYLSMAKADPGRWVPVDGSGSPQEVHAAVLAALRDRKCLEGDAA